MDVSIIMKRVHVVTDSTSGISQQDIEKFSIYHDVKSDIAVSLPAAK